MTDAIQIFENVKGHWVEMDPKNLVTDQYNNEFWAIVDGKPHLTVKVAGPPQYKACADVSFIPVAFYVNHESVAYAQFIIRPAFKAPGE